MKIANIPKEIYISSVVFGIIISMELILLFIFGVAVGSFLNVLIDRIPQEKDLLFSRSECESCHTTLAWHDLIPLVSFLMLGGKCGKCHAKIPWRLFLVELLTGLLFVLLYQYQMANGGNTFSFILNIIILCSFLVIFFEDLDYGIIPDQVLVTLFGTMAVQHVIFSPAHLLEFFIAGIASFLFFFAIFLFTKGRGMGFGDVKFSFLIGFFLGFPEVVLALYLSFLTGAVASVVLIATRKKKFHNDTIPFGPFLLIGTVSAWYWGDAILQFIGSLTLIL